MKSICLPCQRVLTISNGFWLLCALAFFAPVRVQSATIQFYMTNSLGVADTNAFRIVPISSPILADGSWLVTGIPIRITPDVNGFAQTNLQRGNYVVSNAFIVGNWGAGVNPIGGQRGVVFAVPNSSGTYSFTSNAISGGNVYNYNGAQFVATYSNIVSELGFTPLSTNDARAIFPTNTIAAGSNITLSTNTGVITIASTATGGAGTNTVSAGTLVTVVTNSPNYVVSALSQTNGFTSIVTSNALSFTVTNETRILNFTNQNNVFNAKVITNGSIYFQENQGGYWRLKTNGAAHLVFDNSTDSGTFIFQTDGTLEVNQNLLVQSVLADFLNGDGIGVTNVTAQRVIASITNQWKLDATNAVTALATTNTYIAGSGLTFSTNSKPVTVSVTEGTTNRFALTNYVFNVSNNIVTASNAMSVYTIGLSNKLVLASNRFDVLFPTNSGTDGQLVTKSGTNVYWSTVTGGSGTGMQTNFGSGTNIFLTDVTITNNSTLNAGAFAVYMGLSGIIYPDLNGGSLAGTFLAGEANSSTGAWNTVFGKQNHVGDWQAPGPSGRFVYYGSVLGGQFNWIRSNAYASTIAGGEGNVIYGYGESPDLNKYQFIAGGVSNYAAAFASSILGGSNNMVTIGAHRSMVAGSKAVATNEDTFVWSDGRAITSTVAKTFIVNAQNGLTVNTNNPNGNAINAIGGGISATNFNIQGDPFIYRHTNVVSVRGAGSIGVDGTYVYLGSRYTNYLTGGTITNNAGTWVILTAALQSAYSFTGTSPVSTNWTLGIGSAPSPRTFFGGYLDPRGFYVIGDFDSTNLARKYVHPTNAPADGQFVVASGTDSKWSAVASITNISGNAATATVATNWLGGNIYVSASGSDSASGAVGAPLASVSNALTRISGVGTVIVRGGNYFNQTINLGQFQQVDARIINYRGEEPNFWFGENIPPASFASLSNNIFTTTMSQSFSNALVYYTNRWNLNAPAGKWGCLFQTNMPYGTNGIPNVISPTVDRFTETNRCEHTPLYHANSVADMVGATTNNVWFAQGSTLYVRFANSTAGGLYIQGTNLSDSFCWGVAPPGSSISITGIRTYMARNGFDVTGAAEAKLTGCYAFGSGVSGFLAVNSADTLEYTTNVYTGSIELSGCEAVGSQIFGLLVNALNVDHDRQPWTQAFVHGSSFHDGTRESCTFWGDVRATVTDVSCTYNGVPNGWDIGSGYGLISSAAAVAANGYISISNSQAGLQLGETGRRSLAFVSNSRFYENSDCIRMDDTKDVVFSQNNAYYKIQSPFNLVGVDATVTPEHYVEDSGSFSIQQNSATTGLTISGTGVPTANTLSNPRIEPDRFMALKTLLVSGTASPFGATLGALDVTSSFITVRGTGISYFSGPLGFHTNAFETLPVVGQVGGDAYLFNSNGSPARIRGTAFSTTLVSTNTY